MKSTFAVPVLICSLAAIVMTSASALSAKNVIKRSAQDFGVDSLTIIVNVHASNIQNHNTISALQPPSPHMQIADRLLNRVLDITYETLQDLGASREDLEKVQQKRNYIQACYFQAISCY